MSANSTSTEPAAKTPSFVPSKEIESMMKPVSKTDFMRLINRAVTSPALQSHPKEKQT
jgi:hypothetical protein